MRLCWSRLGDVGDGFPASSVDSGEVDDHIAGLVNEVSKDGVGAGAGIGDENAAFHGCFEEFGNGLARFVEEFRIVVSNEYIWSLF